MKNNQLQRGTLWVVGALALCVLPTHAVAARIGAVMISSNPGDAKVYINDKYIGNSPMEEKTLNTRLDVGKYTVKIIKQAGELEEYYGYREIVIVRGGVRRVFLDLNKRVSQAVRDKLKSKYPDGIVELEMVSIPGGDFRMGCLSGENCYGLEKPVHTVAIKPFQLSKYETTFEQWDVCVAFDGCDHLPKNKGLGRGNQPVTNVSWDDVQQYITWLNKQAGKQYRLPTEAEWEYAARAGTQTKYHWGNEIGENKANCGLECGDDFDNAAPVGSFAANGFELHDMNGNVSEWTQDCWSHNYEGAPTDGSAWLRRKCSQRVLRGGSWYNGRRGLRGDIRSAYRYPGNSNHRFFTQGFRLARNP